MINTQKRYKPLYKKFLKLKVNPLNNNKVFKFKRKKWKVFLNKLKKTNKFHTKFKPHTHYNHTASKFASQGNSYTKKFRNDLLAKKNFNYFYGGLLKKYLKTKMTKIYKSKESRDPILTCIEFFESRLDSVLYRSKFCYSIKNARQLIAHKHIKVNNKIEKNKSYILKQGDLIQINLSSVELIRANLRKQLQEQLTFPQQFFPLYKYKISEGSYIHTISRAKPLSTEPQLTKSAEIFLLLKEKEKKSKSAIIELSSGEERRVSLEYYTTLKYLWPIPPSYLTINYNTLEIIFGDIRNYNFSISFPFKFNINSIITNYYRH